MGAAHVQKVKVALPKNTVIETKKKGPVWGIPSRASISTKQRLDFCATLLKV